MASSMGNSNVADQVEVLELTSASKNAQEKNQLLMLEIEAKQRAFSIDVPTLPNDVRQALRSMSLPVRLFGENLANVRDRLRMELARRDITEEHVKQEGNEGQAIVDDDDEEEEITKYSRASSELIRARENFTRYSLERARVRLDKERNYHTDFIEVSRIDEECLKMYKTIKRLGLEGSQYGDSRPLSCIATSSSMVATGSWNGTVKLWDSSLNLVSEKGLAHEDRIMGIALRPCQRGDAVGGSDMLATASIDLTAKLWKVHQEGHASRLCKVAFHPEGNHVVTTSHDHTWRLWDVETGGEILLQDGHYKEVYGVGFHPDGSLCSTTDYGGVVHLWDLRTGKSVHHFMGHAKRVLCTEFSSNGFQLATAGDDGFIKVWDLRKRKQFASVPAHSKLVTQLRFEQQTHSHDGVSAGEYLVSSSFDGTAKVWSSRDWKMLATLRGHEGKVMGAGILKDSVVTCGFDKTLKLWK
ncbi:WD40 repeat-like protein [Fragilariopsis cylindrus CCMP1102]|uniref:WD40 repeat-like protein n=1 Tax=Fragilariopsis cylindrus CCMP1102 TaxID=635003 RepID=A0A1E7FEC2_9STRA|nr:WD40 repeat-like protein [Fragilariopsis cylindrus CCMP1102]|eukprot:OEU16510.1 WD40 repeat-like protein [Fragilariopsis cylindrus CCMP1102]